VFATQNPIEQEATYRLPEAQLDRFLFKLSNIQSLERRYKYWKANIVKTTKPLKSHNNFPYLQQGKIARYKITIKRKLIIEDNLMKLHCWYSQQYTYNRQILYLAPPRASIAINDASKATAAISGRDFVTPDDIKKSKPHLFRTQVLLDSGKGNGRALTYKVIKQNFGTSKFLDNWSNFLIWPCCKGEYQDAVKMVDARYKKYMKKNLKKRLSGKAIFIRAASLGIGFLVSFIVPNILGASKIYCIIFPLIFWLHIFSTFLPPKAEINAERIVPENSSNVTKWKLK